MNYAICMPFKGALPAKIELIAAFARPLTCTMCSICMDTRPHTSWQAELSTISTGVALDCFIIRWPGSVCYCAVLQYDTVAKGTHARIIHFHTSVSSTECYT